MPIFLLGLTLALPTPPVSTQETGVLARVETSIEESARTEILVLGTPHLNGIQGFERPMVASLIEVLARWEPDVVCVETLPGRTVATMLAEGEVFGTAIQRFFGDAALHGKSAQKYLELDRTQADALLRNPEGEVGSIAGSMDRALLALAAFELPTSLLHWANGRAEGESLPAGLDRSIVTFLDERLTRAGELTSVAIPLARRLGLTRVDAIDDHLDKDDYIRIAEQMIEELAGTEEFQSASEAQVFLEAERSLRQAVADGDLLPQYLHMNAPAYGKGDVEAQWGVFLRTRLESGIDRTRLALWDVRNLAIAANVRRAAARVPGGRVLVIIGAAHKPFLDALFETLLDARVVHLASIAPAAAKNRSGGH